MQVGTTKDQGLYNKPSAAVHPGALAAGTLPQYNNIHLLKLMTSISLHNVRQFSLNITQAVVFIIGFSTKRVRIFP